MIQCKYNFDNKEQALTLPYTEKDTVTFIGHFVTKEGEYDEEGNEITPPEYYDKYAVDAIWRNEKPEGFDKYEIDLNSEGIHRFQGVSYLELKRK